MEKENFLANREFRFKFQKIKKYEVLRGFVRK